MPSDRVPLAAKNYPAKIQSPQIYHIGHAAQETGEYVVSDDFLDPNPLLDDALIMRLTYDIATGIHEGEVLAARYGFDGVAGMRRYLLRHPQIIRNAQKTKALMDSDEGSEARVRLKAMHATEELIPATAGIAADPRIAPQQRIDAFKQLSRVSGLDASAAKAAGAGGPAFTLNILFRKNPAEKLELTPEKPMIGLTPGVTDAADTEWDEEI